ncbi:unnamed protein product [Xylocopa violacea]|uniref:AATF leucine zipper-containing domain-containing protein n=1 Tax=Xylocopa violacea TaxID=135666 RepID=A0ABP1P715_XYLVO
MTDALAQVQVTLAVTTQEPDRENLLSLQSDIQELITLTKESLHDVETSSEDLDDDDDADDDDVDNDDDDDDIDDPLAKEYALFKNWRKLQMTLRVMSRINKMTEAHLPRDSFSRSIPC